jgi:CheY-like chemotaxis protein
MTTVMSPRVLVVDDEENIRYLVGSALELAGFDIAVAETGSEALDAVESFRPDVVVLDVMLPDIDGFTVLHRLRDRGLGSQVIFLTARDAVSDRMRGLTTGGAGPARFTRCYRAAVRPVRTRGADPADRHHLGDRREEGVWERSSPRRSFRTYRRSCIRRSGGCSSVRTPI